MFSELLSSPSQTWPCPNLPHLSKCLDHLPRFSSWKPRQHSLLLFPSPIRQILLLPPPEYILNASSPLYYHSPCLTTVNNFLNDLPIFILDNFYLILYTVSWVILTKIITKGYVSWHPLMASRQCSNKIWTSYHGLKKPYIRGSQKTVSRPAESVSPETCIGIHISRPHATPELLDQKLWG